MKEIKIENVKTLLRAIAEKQQACSHNCIQPSVNGQYGKCENCGMLFTKTYPYNEWHVLQRRKQHK